MAVTPSRRSPTLPALVLAGLLVVALAVRLAVLPVPGHWGDVHVMSRWAENLAQFGPWRFYEHDSSVYPALLPFLWPLGLALDGDQLFDAIKALSIPFDLLIGAVLYAVVAGWAGPARGLLASGLYLFNPATIVAGPIWGQVDAAGTLLYLGSLVALSADRYAASGGLAVLAGLAKPQFGLVALPLLVVSVQAWVRDRQPRPVILAGLGGAVAGLGLGLVVGLWPWTWLGLVARAASFQPDTSLNAFNIWALLVGFEVDDAPYVLLGGVLLAAGLAASLLPLRHRRDLATLLTVGMMLAFAFYFLPTRVHERYLFPALAVAAPLAAVHRGTLAAYLVMSVAFALSLMRALIPNTPFTLSPELDVLLLSDAMVWLIGLSLIGSALTLIGLNLTAAERRPRSRSEASAAPG